MSRSASQTSRASPAGPKGGASPTPTIGAVWWSATRPATLAASVSPVLLGTSIAVHDGQARLGPGLLALAVGIGMQLGVNYANDYSDHRRGADSPRRIGPLRASSSGVVPPGQVRLAAFAAFGLAALAGLWLCLLTDWRLLIVGAACLAAGWLYTGGPRPYGYLGLGELFVFVFFGLVACAGTVYVQELRVTPLALWAAGGCGLLADAILLLNNLRDMETDAAAGKRTLATRLGRGRTRTMLAAFFLAAFLCPLLAVLTSAAPALSLIALAALPATTAPMRASAETGGPALVGALKRAAAIEAGYALLWTLGLVL
jgi:1,4-dihydroxy-2-naphthoate polyprenyltransferase